MPAYLGGKKVKTLYYGGKKVKEAWYGGKKVYSLITQPSAPAWKPDTYYSEGDTVYHNGEYYKCNYSHYTDPSWDEPGKGSIWTGYWDKVSDPNAATYPHWMYTNHYEVGDRVTESIDGRARNYECIQSNYGSLAERPSAPDGPKYWKRI